MSEQNLGQSNVLTFEKKDNSDKIVISLSLLYGEAYFGNNIK